MKRFLYFFIILFFGIIACKKEEIPPIIESACSLNEPGYSLYLYDAELLIMQRLWDEQLPELDSIRLPQQDVKRMAEALVAVYESTDILPQADTVINVYEIHRLPQLSTRHISITTDTTTTWDDNSWAVGNLLTGNPQVDVLLTEYELNYRYYVDFPWGNTTRFETLTGLNMSALKYAFEDIDGVKYADLAFSFDGDNIELMEFGEDIILRYSRGWGDCPSGCIVRYYWEFKVNENCEVVFIGSDYE